MGVEEDPQGFQLCFFISNYAKLYLLFKRNKNGIVQLVNSSL